MFDSESYTITTSILFPRLLGFIYFAAFGAFIFQIKGLIGENGILPIRKFLERKRARAPRRHYLIVPSVFWINHSDKALMGVTITGTILSVLLMLGVYPSLMLFLLYFLFLSIVSTGQEFLHFQWETFLLEITFNAFFLTLLTPANPLIWISINLLLFRFHVQCGVVKLQSGDPNWRNMTGVAFHYLSQPIPNAQAWYADKLPMWFQKFSTFLMLFIEIAVPLAMFGPDIARLWVFFFLVGLQILIWFTGNFSFLNYLTVVLCTILLANSYLEGFITPPPVDANPSMIISGACWIVGAFLVAMHIARLWVAFSPSPTISEWLEKVSNFHISNRYGLFGTMTTRRREIIVEGSEDEINWEEYLFYYKPSEVSRRPRWISPYQPHIDWMAWFLPLGTFSGSDWFTNFLIHLLKGTPEVLALLRENPFKDKPPKFIRSVIYDYTYTTFEERKATGNWWNRRYVGPFTRTIMLRKSR